jgi:(2R)-3-sulfolactate dehydrogenase (NADP+)
VRAEAEGLQSHGLLRVAMYAAQAKVGKVDGFATPSVARPRPALIAIDAKFGFAYPAMYKAVDLLPAMAREFGIAAAGINRSHHVGVAGHVVEALAQAGMLALMFANAPAAMAPWGGSRAVFGTDPVAFACPLPDRAPIVVDLSLSKVARGHILTAIQKGEPIPEGWALDPSGRPTTDPAVAVKGSLLPIGGPKGYALSLMVEILCSALSDGEPGFQVTYENMVKRPSNICQFFLVLNPDGFAGSERYGARMTHIAEVIGKAKPMQGEAPPRLPGARGHAVRRKAAAGGIAMFGNLRSALNNVAGMLESHTETA